MTKAHTDYVRGLTDEIHRRSDTSLIEALLADAVGRLADEIDRLRSMLDAEEVSAR